MGKLASIIMKSLQQPAESSYESYFEQKLWSLSEFSSLMADMVPKEYERLIKGSQGCSESEIKKIEQAHAVFFKIAKFLKKKILLEHMYAINHEVYMSKLQFIKWIALHDIPIKKRFFSALSLDLMEAYFAFQPTDVHLRTKNPHSGEYHKALYLSTAQDLISRCGPLTPTQIYRHPRMKNLQKSFEGPKSYYKKRTILELWLPTLTKRSRGRPKKCP